MTTVCCSQNYCVHNKLLQCELPEIDLEDIWYVTGDGEDQLGADCVKCKQFEFRNDGGK